MSPPAALSLRATLTRRLVLGLLCICLVGAIVAYAASIRFAARAFDRSLFDDVQTLATQIHDVAGTTEIALAPGALIWLLADEGDDVVYRVTDLRNRRLLISNGDLGPLPDIEMKDDAPYFRSILRGESPMRVAFTRHRVGPGDAVALVEIAETLRKRDDLSRGILIGTASLMSMLSLGAILLVWSGVSIAFEPLQRLEADVARRSIGDMQPLDPSRAPSEVRGLIEAINRMIARVAEGIEQQHEFLANAAHQLKTPIAGLRLQAQLALKADTPDAARDSLHEVERRATHSAHLIEQLLTLARAEAGDESLPLTRVDLAKLAERVIEQRLTDAIARRIDLGFEGEVDVPTIHANQVLMGELVANLVDNALRHGREGGRVTIAVRRAAGQVVLQVSDDGEGIRHALREQLFRRFGHSDGSSGTVGAGLGLAIVKEIAERYHGVVTIASRPEFDGTRVEVRFPLEQTR